MTRDEVLERLGELTLQGVVRRRAGDLSAAVESVRTCHRLLDSLDDADVFELGPDLVAMRGEWALTATLEGDEGLALRGWERHWDQAERFDLAEHRGMAAASVALVHAFNGDRLYATMWLERADAWPSPESTPLAAVARATLALDELDFEQAEQQLADAEALATSERWAALAFVEARLASMLGKEGSGTARLRATCLAHYPKQWSGGANWQLIDAATQLLDRVNARAAGAPRGGSACSSVTAYADLALALRAIDDGDVERARTIAAADLDRPTASLRTTAGMRLVLAATAGLDGATTDAAGSSAGSSGAPAPVSPGAAGTPPTSRPKDVSTTTAPQAVLAAASTAGAVLAATELAEAALETVRSERLYYLLPLFPQEIVRSRAAQHDDLLPYLSRTLDPEADQTPLTKREREVLWYLAQGYRFEQIAAAEYISVNTVKSHAKKLYRRLGVNDRSAAARYGEANPSETLAPSAEEH
ncbi:helix-turn-helix transcriptional regulator [Herbiconiux liangxiaofengii]|uniref:helix-turn-helix transcriptional regulator n=1 Tax=Herbiconiux liangxiaofengii TaxID=3342795 RepID=UPI0035B9D173